MKPTASRPLDPAWQEALSRTPECLALERLGETLTAAEQAHADGCPRCQTEQALFLAFDESEPAGGEGAAVSWIAAELRRRRTASAAQAPAVRWWRRRPATALAAALVLVLGLGYLLRDTEPGLRQPGAGTQVYRGGRIQPVAPLGSLRTAPRTITWLPIDGAVRYDVAILEVDGSAIWRGTATSDSVALPEDVITRFVPGKTLQWEVTARNASGSIIADSGVQTFRISPD